MEEHNYDELTKTTGKLETELEQEKEKNKKLSQCHLQYEEMTNVDLLLPDKLDVISKDKIREKIKVYSESLEDIEGNLQISASQYDKINELNIKINTLEELLEE